VQKSGAKDESSRSGTLTFNMTHASERGAVREKKSSGDRIARVEKFVGSRFTPACNTSGRAGKRDRCGDPTNVFGSCPERTSCYIIVHTSIHFAFVQQRA
jgi:hypothetical protein